MRIKDCVKEIEWNKVLFIVKIIVSLDFALLVASGLLLLLCVVSGDDIHYSIEWWKYIGIGLVGFPTLFFVYVFFHPPVDD